MLDVTAPSNAVPAKFAVTLSAVTLVELLVIVWLVEGPFRYKVMEHPMVINPLQGIASVCFVFFASRDNKGTSVAASFEQTDKRINKTCKTRII